MRKIIVLILPLLLLPLTVSATDDVTFTADTTISLLNGINLIVTSGSIADQMVVNDYNVVFTLSANSSVNIRSTDRYLLTNTLAVSTDCPGGTGPSTVTLPAQGASTNVTVSPNFGQVCTSGSGNGGGGGGGGGGGTVIPPSVPSTTNGEVTATVSEGGKTSLVTSENSIASVELPANAITASTIVKIGTVAKDTAVSSRPLPADKNLVGAYVFDYTATANSQTVTTFSKTITLTFTYANSQVSGLDESSLKFYYWKETTSEWVVLTSSVDVNNNKVTANTNHFTYFAVLAVAGVTTGETTLVDGDLIRNPSAEGLAQFDIYIVKLVGAKKFKRLILSPHVFESYAHFDKNNNGSPWDDVVTVNQATMDSCTTSDLVRVEGGTKVYKLSDAAGSDTGNKQWLNMTAEAFLSKGYEADSIYTINQTDLNAYTNEADITG